MMNAITVVFVMLHYAQIVLAINMKKNRLNRDPKIHAVVAPVKKIVYIFIGNKEVKRYRFKMDIPFKIVTKTRHGYDWGTWSVADRDYTYEVDVKEFDPQIMSEVREKALIHYKSKQTLNE